MKVLQVDKLYFLTKTIKVLNDWLLTMLMNGQVRIAHFHADGNLVELESELGMV
ncbi:hypothetical protein [uncultured Formosa sp.]|uniref:hypothetical protein n=1 Tax=uncultured Formosa sp. TaxID=255435 RepID=UPI00260585AB|nr:hypothetical protein [uncultured Formosa sp.]